METFVAERVIEGRKPLNFVVHALAEAFPTAPALSLCFTLTTIAANLEETWGQNSLGDYLKALDIYRMSSVVAADIFYLERQMTRPVTARDLCVYWDAQKDPFFMPR